MKHEMKYEYELSARGFKHMKPIEADYGAEVRVYESSAADTASLWIAVKQSTQQGDGEVIEAHGHLSLENARKLRKQLKYLIKHHYHCPVDEVELEEEPGHGYWEAGDY